MKFFTKRKVNKFRIFTSPFLLIFFSSLLLTFYCSFFSLFIQCYLSSTIFQLLFSNHGKVFWFPAIIWFQNCQIGHFVTVNAVNSAVEGVCFFRYINSHLSLSFAFPLLIYSLRAIHPLKNSSISLLKIHRCIFSVKNTFAQLLCRSYCECKVIWFNLSRKYFFRIFSFFESFRM